MDVLVSDLMARDVPYLSPDDTAIGAAKAMAESKTLAVLIKEGQTAIGIVTSHDLVTKVMALEGDPATCALADVMSHPIITVSPDTSMKEASRLMRDEKVEALVVCEEGKIRGIVTTWDFMYYVPVKED